MSDKYNGQPPSYPQPAHHDAGPYGSPPPQNYGGQNMYGQPQHNQYGAPPGGMQQGYYGGPPPPQGPNYGGEHPNPQQQMYYGNPAQGQQGSPQYNNHQNGGKPGGLGRGGFCAAILTALGCCCCLECLF